MSNKSTRSFVNNFGNEFQGELNDRLDDTLDTEMATRNIKFTEEGGIALAFENQTGGSSVAGQLVSASTSVDNAVSLVSKSATAASQQTAIGAIYNAGVATGSSVWVVTHGYASMLKSTGAAISRGMVLYSSTSKAGAVDGTAAYYGTSIGFDVVGIALAAAGATASTVDALIRI